MRRSTSDDQLKRDHRTYRSLLGRKQARRLKSARRVMPHPGFTCPHCCYDLRGVLTDDMSFHSCPECGGLVSPPGAIMTWWRRRRTARAHMLIAFCSGPAQGLLAFAVIALILNVGVGPSIGRAMLYVWMLCAAINLFYVATSAWQMQAIGKPLGGRRLAVLVTAICLFANLIAFAVVFHTAFALVARWA